MNDIIISLIGLVGVMVPLFWQAYKFKKERDKALRIVEDQKTKLSVYEDILTIQSISRIGDAVSEIFEKTIADRFLILIGIERKGRMETVSVIFEQHKRAKHNISAIARYKDVEIDDHYREMVNDAERYGVVSLETNTMKASKLKDWYTTEGVCSSEVRFIHRKTIKSNSFICCFSSISTHQEGHFSFMEKTQIKAIHDLVIQPLVKGILDDSDHSLLEDLTE